MRRKCKFKFTGSFLEGQFYQFLCSKKHDHGINTFSTGYACVPTIQFWGAGVMENRCTVCGREIKVMSQIGTGFCSRICEKKREEGVMDINTIEYALTHLTPNVEALVNGIIEED